MRYLAFLLSVYFLIGGLIPHTDFSQLLKLGNLKAHYQVHHEETEDTHNKLSYFKFLISHLFFVHSHDNNHGHDHDDHQDLPFHSFGNQPLSWFTSLVPGILIFQSGEKAKMNIYSEDPHSCNYRGVIFQPPIA